MARRSPFALDRLLERIAAICPKRHRELAQGMVAELEAIPDRGERRRFVLGAVAAIARMALSHCARSAIHVVRHLLSLGEPGDGADRGGPSMSSLTVRQLLRRHVTPFLVSLASLTLLLLANHAARQVPRLSGQGAPTATIIEALVLALPFIVALTIPMSVFLAVSWVFTRLGAEGALAALRQKGHGVRRLIAPVLGAAAVVATLTLISNTEVMPRSNARLVEVLVGAPRAPSDREMTIGQLREASRGARAEGGAEAAERAIAYEVEIQKRLALAAACVILALFGATTALRFPRGGMMLFVGSGVFAFTTYYVSLVAGESLADRQLISPLVGMWMSNTLLLGVVLLLLWQTGRRDSSPASQTLAIEG